MLALKLSNSADVTVVTQNPVAAQRLKPDTEAGGHRGKLEGWDSSAGEWVCPADGVYLCKYSLGYSEPADGGSQATAAAAFVTDEALASSVRQDVQLPQGFFHGFDGVVFGYFAKGKKLYLDFTNATGNDIILTSILIQIQRLHPDVLG